MSKKKLRRCDTKYCTKLAPYGRKKCWKCIKRKYRAAYPIVAAYQNLRNNAKRRGKEFTITMDQFKKFCRKTKYLQGRGRAADCYSIDRIDNNKGYTVENIRVLTVAENSSKGAKILIADWQHNYYRVVNK